MIEALADQVELNSLIMTANKKSWLKRTNDQLREQVSRIANYVPGQNGVATATAQPTMEDDSGIVNRSPTTTNNNYPVRSDAPWVALIALLVVGGLALAGMWMMNQPKGHTAPVITTTTTTPTPAGPVTSTTKTNDPNYIEFYKP